MTARVKSQGASNRYSGRETEQRVARFLRQYWPASKRLVRTGWRNRHTESGDEGDFAGVPFLVQAKGHQRGADQFVPGKKLADIWEAANDQALAAGLPFAVIIEKRIGCAEVDGWFAWLPVRLVASLAICAHHVNLPTGTAARWDDIMPDYFRGHGDRLARMNVREFLALVKAAGVPMETPSEAQASALKNRG